MLIRAQVEARSWSDSREKDMSLAVGVPTTILAVQALLKFRGRVDQILALREASEDVPFRLPPAPFDFQAQREALFSFFDSDEGRLVLELHARSEDYATLRANPVSPATFGLRNDFLQLFCEASDSAPIVLGPQSEARSVRSSREMRLSYYVVASHRLARNPTLTRILLASADTLLEVAGEGAGLFVSNPKTQAIVSTLIQEFAGKRDFDDENAELIFKSLLRSAVVAAMENQGAITEEPAVIALFGSLADLRDAHGDDFVARILTTSGFQTLVGKYLTQVAADTSLLVEDGPFRTVLSATLTDLAERFDTIFDDPKALFGVLEVALTSVAGQGREHLFKSTGGKPLVTVVLGSVLLEIENRGRQDQRLASFANGEIASGLFQTALAAVAANPKSLASAAKIGRLSANLVSGLADLLSRKGLTDGLSTQTARVLVSGALRVLSENSHRWVGKDELTTRLVAGVLQALVPAVEDGLSTDDVNDLLDLAIRTTAAHPGLLANALPVDQVLESVGGQLASKAMRAVLAPELRGEVVLMSLTAVARNPKVWARFAEADRVQPLVGAVFAGLASDRTAMLAGPYMVESIRMVLAAAALQGQAIIEQSVDAAMLNKLLKLGLRKIDQAIGRGIDAVTLPDYLHRLVIFYLDDPFELTRITNPDFQALHELAIEGMERLDDLEGG